MTEQTLPCMHCTIILHKERELNVSRALTLEANDNMNFTEQLKSPSAVVQLTSSPIYHAVSLDNLEFLFLNIKFGILLCSPKSFSLISLSVVTDRAGICRYLHLRICVYFLVI